MVQFCYLQIPFFMSPLGQIVERWTGRQEAEVMRFPFLVLKQNRFMVI